MFIYSHSIYARATDTSVCDTSTITCSDVADVDTYRTMNGECNNKENPAWGAAGSTQRRWLDEVYADSGRYFSTRFLTLHSVKIN